MNWLALVYSIPVLLVSVILHEVAHGKTAELLGDPTARSLGRITLNPIKHIDFFLTLLLPALLIMAGSPVIFGGAKPVPVNPYYFRHPRKGMALVAVAGPITNLILAALSYGALLILEALRPKVLLLDFELLLFVIPFFQLGMIINVVLAVFNMLPVPPLDGGRIAVGLLPAPYARSWAKLEPYGLFIVVALLYLNVVEAVLTPVIRFVGEMMP